MPDIDKKVFCLSLLTVFFSCGFINSPKKSNYQIERTYTANYTEPMESKGELNFLELLQSAGIGKMSPRSFDDKFFRVVGGENQRFFLDKGGSDISCYDISTGFAYSLKIRKETPFGLFIGQSKSEIYYYHGSDRGKVFYSYNLLDNNTIKHSIENFIVIRVVGINDDPNVVLTCGVITHETPKLGFYLINLKTSKVIKTLYQFDLKNAPDGDPGVYSGDFFKFDNHIFFRFDKRSGIFRFDENANFLTEIITPDQFNFPNQTKKSSADYDELYKEMFVLEDRLYVRTRFINTKNRLLIFDMYDLSEDIYKSSFGVQLNYPENEYSFEHLWVYQDSKGLNFLQKRKDNPTRYLHQVLSLNKWN